MRKASLLFTILLFLSDIGFAQTVTIGTQVWSSKNLDVSTFRNGDPIPEIKTKADWEKANLSLQPGWCYYNNDSVNGAKFGKLYNWYAVNDRRGLAPVGYHIPSDAEWTILTNYLGGKLVAGKKMKSNSGWDESGNGTNSSGFFGFPGGYRAYGGSFYHLGNSGYWWSSTEYALDAAWSCLLVYNYDNGFRYGTIKEKFFSVRCLID